MPKSSMTAVSPEVRITVHSGTFRRCFTKMGQMDPFVLISPLREVRHGERARTAKQMQMVSAAHSGGHKNPVWNWDFPAFQLDEAREVVLDVYDRNRLHRNVLMGTATISLCDLHDSCSLAHCPCTCIKKGKETGIIYVSVVVVFDPRHAVTEVHSRSLKSIGESHNTPLTTSPCQKGRTKTAPPTGGLIGKHLEVHNSGKYLQVDALSDNESSSSSILTTIYPPSLNDATTYFDLSEHDAEEKDKDADAHPRTIPEDHSLRFSKGDLMGSLRTRDCKPVAVSTRTQRSRTTDPPSCFSGVVKYLFCQ